MNSLFLALELFYIPNRVLTPTVYPDRMLAQGSSLNTPRNYSGANWP